jgi:hypothetical protein
MLVLSDGQTSGKRGAELRELIGEQLAYSRRRLQISALAYTQYCDLATMQALPMSGNCKYRVVLIDFHFFFADSVCNNFQVELVDFII